MIFSKIRHSIIVHANGKLLLYYLLHKDLVIDLSFPSARERIASLSPADGIVAMETRKIDRVKRNWRRNNFRHQRYALLGFWAYSVTVDFPCKMEAWQFYFTSDGDVFIRVTNSSKSNKIHLIIFLFFFYNLFIRLNRQVIVLFVLIILRIYVKYLNNFWMA